jgi:putative tryptophan/tyrosine transport system substrate-binding protein
MQEMTMTRHRIGLLITLMLAILVAPLGAEVLQTGTVARIGVLHAGSPPDPFVEAFRGGLRDLGYTEDHNIAVEYRWAEDRLERLPILAAELVSRKVDVLVTGSTPGAKATQEATSTIPIVFVAVGDPVGVGVVQSLARPGANVTGLTHVSVDLTAKSWALLVEAIPGIRQVAVLKNPASPITALKMRGIEDAAHAFGLQLHLFDVRSPGEVESRLSAIGAQHPDALFTIWDPVTFGHRQEIAAFATASRLPSMYEIREFVDAGGLMSYGTKLTELWRRAAIYVDKILKGAKPADLPVEQPMTFELVINLKTAEALGLTIPPTLLFQATEVIR